MKVLKMSARWCQPCKVLSSVIASVKTDVPVEEIDIDKNLQAVRDYNIRGVPTLILLDDEGKEVRRHTGSMTATSFEQFVTINPIDTD